MIRLIKGAKKWLKEEKKLKRKRKLKKLRKKEEDSLVFFFLRNNASHGDCVGSVFLFKDLLIRDTLVFYLSFFLKFRYLLFKISF